MKILITGGTGFVGSAIVQRLLAEDQTIRLARRRRHAKLDRGNLDSVEVGDIDSATEWHGALSGVDAVVHLAARAHVLREYAANPEAAFREVNYEGTKRLAKACRGRVKRFVYLSSIGVHGLVDPNKPINEDGDIAPGGAYAQSKADAELHLQKMTARGDLDCRIIRPPLVYGPDAPGNLARLVALVNRGIPLPLAAVSNRRSLIGVDHLARAVGAVLKADNMSRSAFVVADREVVSTADIIRAIARGLGRSPRLWPVPPALLKFAGIVTGRRDTVAQLIGNLEIDASNFRDEFGDLQPHPTLQGLTGAVSGMRRIE